MDAYTIRSPTVEDGAGIASIAWRTGSLDRNSSYAYLLWCRDFARTSAVADADGTIAGFVTGYLRPEQSGTLFIWQVAVDDAHRRVGLARRLLDHLIDRVGPRSLEATITLDNEPSRALFAAVARDRGAQQETSLLFDTMDFPDEHGAEHLLRIAPLGGR